MARDEALLRACTASDAEPVLRFYAWSPATISLGYFQDYADYEGLPPPAGDLPVVRRTTGGGAILHDLELTYALVVPTGHPLIRHRPNHLYTLAHQAIINAVGHGARLLGGESDACGDAPTITDPQSPIPNPQSSIANPQSPIANRQPSIVNRQPSIARPASSRRGPFFCFHRRHALDVVIDDAKGPGGVSKIAGSAQRRTAGAVLQHGSIILDSRYPQQPVATWSDIDAPITFQQAAERLAPAFAESLEVAFTRGSWPDEELSLARVIERRHAGPAWTVHRRR
jgi:lipoate-protein ligase A